MTEGIRRDRYGYRVYVKVGNLQREKRYPPEASIKTMQAWRDETKVALRKLPSDAPIPGTLRADVDRYLLQVRAMPTYAERARHLELWIAALGAHRSRHELTAADIRAVLHDWRAKRLEPATCNKRRTALMHLWTVLDGKGASNPVRDVPKFAVNDPLPRGRDPHAIDALLKKAPRCRSRAACRVLLWTGMRPAELQRAEPEDLSLTHHFVIARTAKGGRTRTIPLTTQAESAWREFDRADTWHRVPQWAPLNVWLKRRTRLPIRVYDLRHSYGTALARRGARLDVIGSLMGHSTLELTRRYTLAAITPDAATATAKLARAAGSRAGSRKRPHKHARKSA